MEQEPYIDIPRRSPLIQAELGGRACTLTWYNTLLQLYLHPFRDLSHIQHTDDDITSRHFIGEPLHHKLAQTLLRTRYPVRMDAEPTDEVLRGYADMLNNSIDTDIQRLFGDSD